MLFRATIYWGHSCWEYWGTEVLCVASRSPLPVIHKIASPRPSPALPLSLLHDALNVTLGPILYKSQKSSKQRSCMWPAYTLVSQNGFCYARDPLQEEQLYMPTVVHYNFVHGLLSSLWLYLLRTATGKMSATENSLHHERYIRLMLRGGDFALDNRPTTQRSWHVCGPHFPALVLNVTTCAHSHPSVVSFFSSAELLWH